jgi:hypothetical protein
MRPTPRVTELTGGVTPVFTREEENKSEAVSRT